MLNIYLDADGTPFRFGKDAEGNFGYIITDETGADSVIPFKSSTLDLELIVPDVRIGNYTSDTVVGSKSYTFEESGTYLVITYSPYATYESNLAAYAMRNYANCTSSSAIIEHLANGVYKVVANAGDSITVTTIAGSSGYKSYKGFRVYKCK